MSRENRCREAGRAWADRMAECLDPIMHEWVGEPLEARPLVEALLECSTPQETQDLAVLINGSAVARWAEIQAAELDKIFIPRGDLPATIMGSP